MKLYKLVLGGVHGKPSIELKEYEATERLKTYSLARGWAESVVKKSLIGIPHGQYRAEVWFTTASDTQEMIGRLLGYALDRARARAKTLREQAEAEDRSIVELQKLLREGLIVKEEGK